MGFMMRFSAQGHEGTGRQHNEAMIEDASRRKIQARTCRARTTSSRSKLFECGLHGTQGFVDLGEEHVFECAGAACGAGVVRAQALEIADHGGEPSGARDKGIEGFATGFGLRTGRDTERRGRRRGSGLRLDQVEQRDAEHPSRVEPPNRFERRRRRIDRQPLQSVTRDRTLEGVGRLAVVVSEGGHLTLVAAKLSEDLGGEDQPFLVEESVAFAHARALFLQLEEGTVGRDDGALGHAMDSLRGA